MGFDFATCAAATAEGSGFMGSPTPWRAFDEVLAHLAQGLLGPAEERGRRGETLNPKPYTPKLPKQPEILLSLGENSLYHL